MTNNNNALLYHFIYYYRGLGVENVFLNLLRVYCDPGNLVIVLGSSNHEEEYYITELQCQDVSPLPRVLTAENTSTDR